MHASLRRAIAALTVGDDAQRHFDLAAERLQHALLEVAIPAIDGLEIGFRAEPARLVGGDYVDLLRDGDGLIFGLGDASGKSLAAAINAMMLRAVVRGLVTALGSADLAALVAHTNTVVAADMADGSFITFVLAAIDADSCLRVVNAGHEPPMILRAATRTVETLERHGLVLGIDPAARYVEQATTLETGDTVVVYTDGLTEATDTYGEFYTMERVMDDLIEHAGLTPQAIADGLFEKVKHHAAGPLRDDATILVVRRR